MVHVYPSRRNSSPPPRSPPSSLNRVAQYASGISTRLIFTQAAQKDSNFNHAKEAVAVIQLDHPLIYAMISQPLCDGSEWYFEAPETTHAAAHGLNIPAKHMRKKAPYLALLIKRHF